MLPPYTLRWEKGASGAYITRDSSVNGRAGRGVVTAPTMREKGQQHHDGLKPVFSVGKIMGAPRWLRQSSV